jgi:TM2 domain-containing membrane protein YozV
MGRPVAVAAVAAQGAAPATAPIAPPPPAMIIESAITTVPPPVAKNKMTFILLGVFLGALGAHNFYAGYYGKAIGQVCLTVLTLGYGSPMSWLWAVIEICTVTRDNKGVQFQS